MRYVVRGAMWVGAVALLSAALLWSRFRLEPLHPVASPLLPVSVVCDGRLEIRYPLRALLRDIAAFNDEIFAYFMYQYYQGIQPLRQVETLLTYRADEGGVGKYVIVSRLPDHLPQAAAFMQELYAIGLVGDLEWVSVPESEASRFEGQTRIFRAAYNLPPRYRLDGIPHSQLGTYLRRFLRYKSTTDPRIRKRIEPIPTRLNQEQAGRLAADIITIAAFYDLPLDSFLGIGAMENNYMNIAGDLEHSIWKRRPAKDDVVLERRRGRVRVVNRSEGVWQITRETLRYAHRLYRKDTRDYSMLPPHLRPLEDLNVQTVSPEVLTTYAGLLFRDLLDRFDGETSLAVGAYNGGPGRPNPRYEAGVRMAATHARTLLERAAAMNGESVINRQWLMP